MVKPKVNIKDVAARANVHPSTVSRVMNPQTRTMVSTPVANRIIRVAADMGYARSPLASGLRTGKSFTIGVIIPDLSNPVFPPVVRGIERALAAEGYIAILADSGNSRLSEQAIYESMKSRRIEGLILATAHIDDALVGQCLEDGLPVVTVNRTTNTAAASSVTTNDELGIGMAVSHLEDLDHTRIAFLGGPEDTSTGRDRLQAFRSRSRSKPELCVSCTAFTEQAGYEGTQGILAAGQPFTAVVAANDLLALGCYDVLAERGMQCPQDVSVTGFNDMPFADRFSPPLTTVHIPHGDLGLRAARLLLEEIRDAGATRQTIRLDPQLVVRGSTARANEKD